MTFPKDASIGSPDIAAYDVQSQLIAQLLPRVRDPYLEGPFQHEGTPGLVFRHREIMILAILTEPKPKQYWLHVRCSTPLRALLLREIETVRGALFRPGFPVVVYLPTVDEAMAEPPFTHHLLQRVDGRPTVPGLADLQPLGVG